MSYFPTNWFGRSDIGSVEITASDVRRAINAPVSVEQGTTATPSAILYSLTGAFRLSGTPQFRLLSEVNAVVQTWQSLSSWNGNVTERIELEQAISTGALAVGNYTVEIRATVILITNRQVTITSRVRLHVTN